MYQNIRDFRNYRLQFLDICLKVWGDESIVERSRDAYQSTISPFLLECTWNLLADGVVAGAAEPDSIPFTRDPRSPGEVSSADPLGQGDRTLEQRIRLLIIDVARYSPCTLEKQAQDIAAAVKTSLTEHLPASRLPPHTTPSKPKHSLAQASRDEVPNVSSSEKVGSNRPPMLSFITALTSPSSSTIPREPVQSPPISVPDPIEADLTQPNLTHRRHDASGCRSLSAAVTLITTFQALAFSPPYSLTDTSSSRAVRNPASYQCIQVFRDLISLLRPTGFKGNLADEDEGSVERPPNASARCRHARLAILQWLVRLRADRDHKLYAVGDLDRQVEPFANLIGRSGGSPSGVGDEGIQGAPTSTRTDEKERNLNRHRSVTRRSLGGNLDMHNVSSRGPKDTKEGVRARDPSRNHRDASRSRSRTRHVPEHQSARDPLWAVPESLPFVLSPGAKPSEGVTTYVAGMAAADEDTRGLWLPVSAYVTAITDIITEEEDWEILSYTLCHLPLQLSNKHLFCGPLTSNAIAKLADVLCNAIRGGKFGRLGEFPKGLRSTDVQAVAYHSLAVMVSFKRLLSRTVLDAMVEAFLQGLSRHHVTIKPCLHALGIAAFELQPQVTRVLSGILLQLSQIVTNPSASVHILELLIILGSIPSLYANFTEEDFRRVFTVALKYIQHHNMPESSSISPNRSHALSQHLIAIAYYNIYIWFLAVKLPDRPKHIPHITRQLLIANSQKSPTNIDEPSEVCFDWLARYTYGDADAKPTRSFLGDAITPASDPIGNPSVISKTWIRGNAIVTIRTLGVAGWLEMTSRRPSGMTTFLCRLENGAELTFRPHTIVHGSESQIQANNTVESTPTSQTTSSVDLPPPGEDLILRNAVCN